MSTGAPQVCQKARCEQPVPPALAGEQLCLDHFLDRAHVRANDALESCQQGKAIDAATLDSLLADAHVTLKALAEMTVRQEPERQERVLELLLCISNLHEHITHHSGRLSQTA